MTTDNDNTKSAGIPDTINFKLHLIQMKREALDAEHHDLMASEDWLSHGPHPKGAEYKGNGAWLHSAGGIFAISRGPVFEFLAISDAGGGVFETLEEAVALLDGVRDGIRDRAKAFTREQRGVLDEK